MFIFGDSKSLIVKYYIDATRNKGPKFAEGHFTEISEEDAVEYYVHTAMAYNQAKIDKASQDVLDALHEEFVAVFRYVIQFSEKTVKAVEEGRFSPPVGAKSFYREIVRELRHPSSADAG